VQQVRSDRVKPMPIRRLRLICLALCLGAGPVGGTRDIAALCDDAARTAARNSDTPINVLLAITRVETGRGAGRDLRPWPWTINQAGSGYWFDTATEAAAAAETALRENTGNLDIGCFQLNHRWHGMHFASLDLMFDPLTNASYAAGFLSDLYREMGNWPAAIAAYHSRSEAPAATYLAKIETVMADLGPIPATRSAAKVTAKVSRQNTYPLLQAGSRGTGGSLVPRLSSNRPLFGAAP